MQPGEADHMHCIPIRVAAEKTGVKDVFAFTGMQKHLQKETLLLWLKRVAGYKTSDRY